VRARPPLQRKFFLATATKYYPAGEAAQRAHPSAGIAPTASLASKGAHDKVALQQSATQGQSN